MKRFYLFVLTTLLFINATAQQRFEIKDSSFLLDGKSIQLICGEMHYPRVPKEYWQDRLKRAKAMGLNTISTYVFWNFHERTPDVFDFQGQADLAEFIRLAQKEGLYVILRPGPYVCAEWDFGGYPWWLLEEKGMVFRSNDERFLKACNQYIDRLGKELSGLTVENGGPILMVQVENEYGSYSNDKVYLGKLRDMIKNAGFNVPLITCDGGGQMEAGHVDGAFPTINGVVGEDIFKIVDKFSPGGPYFVAEFYPAWFDVWGTPHPYRDYKKPTEQLDWMLKNKVSVSIYMFHGGTNFWYTNGANTAYGYAPQPTSYDYDAPLGEWGNITPKYLAFREVVQKYLPEGEKLPDVPALNKVISFAPVTLTETADLPVAFTKRVQSDKILTMEDLGQDFGYVHYETILNKPGKGTLVIKDVRDYAVVLIDGKQVGSLDRRYRQSKIEIDVKKVPAKLEILVENVGRVNYGSDILNNHKGITDKVTFNDAELTGWTISPLPLYKADVDLYKFSKKELKGKPAFHRGYFDLAETGDCFISTKGWGKGAVWVNGHSLGKFWNIGPQQTLYVPAPWLKKEKNEIVVFEMEDTGYRTIEGLSQPILDELGTDKNKPVHVERDYSKQPQLDPGDMILKTQMERKGGTQLFPLENSKTLRHLCIETLDTYDNLPAGISEIEVITEDGKMLSKDTWQIVYASSENRDNNSGIAENAIDGNLATSWKSSPDDNAPYRIIIDLGEIYNMKSVRIRQGDINKEAVKDFRLYGRPQFFLFK